MPVYKDEKGRGTWYVSLRYQDWTGTRKVHKKRGFPTKREAQEYEREFLTKGQKAKGYTVQMLWEDFREDFVERVRASTTVGRDGTYRKHIGPFIGEMEITNVTPTVVRELLMDRRKHLAPSSVNRVKNLLSSMFNFAMVYCGHKFNPCSVVRSPDKAERKQMQIWTPEEFEKAAQFMSPKYAPILYFLFYSGARLGEALALTFGDIKGNVVHIDKTLSPVSKSEVTPPKTSNAIRDITVPSFVLNKIKMPYNVHPTDRVFPFANASIRRALRKAASEAGLPIIRIHDLRHSHASYLVAHFPIPAVSKRLGHANSQITMSTYAHALQSDVDAIGTFLENKEPSGIKTPEG